MNGLGWIGLWLGIGGWARELIGLCFFDDFVVG